MRIEDDFRDLAPLRPSQDDDRWMRMVGNIERAAAPELARRARAGSPPPGLLVLLSDWTRPALSAAALVAVLAGTLILRTPGSPAEASPGLGDALGYPSAVSDWVEGGWTPSVEELLVAMEAGR